MIVTYANEELAAVRAAQAALEALERAAAALLSAWRGFLARTEAHAAVRAA
jgi:chemotaxis regulatin CheY-phosphate phosphatase CheZ